MKEMAANESYFSLAEQSLMNTTKITSYDAKNKLSYTTEDKLYLLMGYSVNDGETMQKQIYAGSRDQIVLSFNKYWSRGTDFFLRGTWDTNITCASLYKGMEGVGSNNQYASADIRPALNLKLTDVLFASVRRPAEGTTTVSKDSPMILRLDGTGKNIGTVTYNAETKVITTNKDTAASGAVYLMVLGKHNGTDTIYCATIAPGTAKVNTSTASWLADVDLSTCKIWLETVSDGMLYAVTATPEPTALEQISSVEVTIDPPTAGNWLAANAACATTGVSNTKPVNWTPNDDSVVGGKEYTASVTLTAASGYEFADSTAAMVNGEQATVTKNGDGTLTVTHSFTAATVKDKLKEIIAPDPVTAPNGMFYWKIEELLPKTVDIMLENQTVTSASVTWDITPLKNEYDATELTEQRVTLTGTVICPATSAPATPAPETPAPASYYIMDGANSSWVRNEDGSMAIRGNGEFSKFTGVKVDGVLIDPANYIVTEGSTIITLKPEYLNTLAEGSHSFEILWADGSAATDFTVTGNAADYIAVNAPQTGYDSHKALWTLLLLAALSGLAAISITKKSKVNQ